MEQFRFTSRIQYEVELTAMLSSGDYDEAEYDKLEDEYFAFCEAEDTEF